MLSAEELGISVEKIASVVSDTDAVGYADNSAGSRTLNATGQAVVAATREAITEMKLRAASGWNVAPDQVTWQDGEARNDVTGEFITFEQICRDSQRTGGPLDGRLVMTDSNVACSRLSIVRFDTGPKRSMGHLLGGEKNNFFNSRY